MTPSESTHPSRGTPAGLPKSAAQCFGAIENSPHDADCHTLLVAILEKLAELQETLHGTAKAYFTVAEAAKLLGRSEYTVRRYVAEKRLSAERVVGTGPRGRLLIPRESLMLLIKGAGVRATEDRTNCDQPVALGRSHESDLG